MTRSEIWIALGALLLVLFWLASPAAAQLILHGDGSLSQGTPECSDGVDNDDADDDVDIADPECWSDGQYQPYWKSETTARAVTLGEGKAGCGGGAEEPVLALLVPLVWLYGRRRSRKA
jgi:hypothetical protein